MIQNITYLKHKPILIPMKDIRKNIEDIYSPSFLFLASAEYLKDLPNAQGHSESKVIRYFK